MSTLVLMALTFVSFGNEKTDLVELSLAPPVDARAVERLVGHWLFETFTTGDVLIITEGLSRNRVATFVIDEQVGAKSPALRRKMIPAKYRAEFSSLGRFLRALAAEQSESYQAPHLLRSLDALSTRRAEFPGKNIHFVFVGFPLVLDPNPVFSMAPCRYPNDAHLSDQESIYQVKNRAGTLAGVTVHIISTERVFCEYAIDTHLAGVNRFWGLFVAACGGKFVGVKNNLDHLSRLKSAYYPAVTFEVDTSVDKMDSIVMETPAMAEEATRQQEALWQPVTENPPPPSPSGQPQPVEIGIAWSSTGSVDLDIYVTHSDDDGELSFRNRATQAGTFHRDLVSPPGRFGERGFETVSYHSPMTIEGFQPIAINHFAGPTSDPIQAEIRIRFGSTIYFRSFSLPPGSGSGARGRNTPDHSAWVTIDPAAIVGRNVR
ncbi:hypothetical protein SCOR_27520 [Sulfidibacter corallicola]|uniref:Uncharacterized protein n=1 Tax=Sulfidibacter corallicola TaxID=2818388 RepID=A0A8A4TMB6_SULCO|nr:hypothetical protein [Sulfidibacter corallicola]QTD50693.1 hypothetical protein J3U87_34335 [Sulfidibacter corallicola]